MHHLSTVFNKIFVSLACSRFSSAFVLPVARQQAFRLFASVTGTVYSSEDRDAPVVRLFTKEGCTLCDKAKDVLLEVRDDFPHSLEQIDITDPEHEKWFDKYKYDIPVLHMDSKFWIKHRLSKEKAHEGMIEAKEGRFAERDGDPDAGAFER